MRKNLLVLMLALLHCVSNSFGQNCVVVDVDFQGPFDGHQLNVCDSEAPVDLMSYVVTLGGSFSGTGVVDNVFYPDLAGAGSFPLYYVMGNDSCETESKVLAAFEQAEIFPMVSTDFCLDDAPITLEVNPPSFTDETFIFVNDLFTFLPDAVYDPAVQGPGVDTLVYQWVELSGNGCKSSDTVIVRVAEDLAYPEFITEAQSVCTSAGTIELQATPPGGLFRSNAGVLTGALFDATASGPGDYEIYYDLSDALGICTRTDTVEISVQAAANLAFEVDLSNCDAIPDTLRYTGDPRDAGVVLIWDISDYDIVGNEGDSVIYVQWDYPGIYSVQLDASNNDCASVNPDDTFIELPDRSDFICKNVVWAPNAFTPNGDGNNDEFLIFGENIKSINWEIYNRWGEKLFQSGSMAVGWDGEYKGSEASNGVYFYTLEAEFLNGEIIPQNGTVTLIR